MKYLHSAHIVHRDIKPANITLKEDCSLKLVDFGLVRNLKELDKEKGQVLTDYVGTRWYRAPEILLGSMDYSTSMEMWSVGLIIAEMIKGKPILMGNSTRDQIKRLLEITGPPTDSDIASINSDYALNILETMELA